MPEGEERRCWGYGGSWKAGEQLGVGEFCVEEFLPWKDP